MTLPILLDWVLLQYPPLWGYIRYSARHGGITKGKNMNTKAIARKVGLATAQVNEIARDLGIKMSYRADNRYWQINDRHQAAQLIEMLTEQTSN